jgi:hypothetical protein
MIYGDYMPEIKTLASALGIDRYRDSFINMELDKIVHEIHRDTKNTGIQQKHWSVIVSTVLQRIEEQPWTLLEKIYIAWILGIRTKGSTLDD